jgi:RNA polymerase sigma-70 factor (ECF subfamily)
VEITMSLAVDAFLERLPPALVATIDAARAAEWLAAAYGAARGEWPDVALSDTAFAAYVGDRIAADGTLDLDGAEQLRLSDLYLACACALGHGDAIACFRTRYLRDIQAALCQLGVRPSEVDELGHLVLEEILVDDRGRAAIAGYSGRGTLRRWARSVALRIAAKRHRSEQRDVAIQPQLAAVIGEVDDDTELQHLKQQYTGNYEAALVAAIAALDVRDRNVLRYYFIDGLTIDDLARVHDVHRSTAARWVGKAREHLYADVLARLRVELGMSPSEIASVGRMVRSELDVSFTRLLR